MIQLRGRNKGHQNPLESPSKPQDSANTDFSEVVKSALTRNPRRHPEAPQGEARLRDHGQDVWGFVVYFKLSTCKGISFY